MSPAPYFPRRLHPVFHSGIVSSNLLAMLFAPMSNREFLSVRPNPSGLWAWSRTVCDTSASRVLGRKRPKAYHFGHFAFQNRSRMPLDSFSVRLGCPDTRENPSTETDGKA